MKTILLTVLLMTAAQAQAAQDLLSCESSNFIMRVFADHDSPTGFSYQIFLKRVLFTEGPIQREGMAFRNERHRIFHIFGGYTVTEVKNNDKSLFYIDDEACELGRDRHFASPPMGTVITARGTGAVYGSYDEAVSDAKTDAQKEAQRQCGGLFANQISDFKISDVRPTDPTCRRYPEVCDHFVEATADFECTR